MKRHRPRPGPMISLARSFSPYRAMTRRSVRLSSFLQPVLLQFCPFNPSILTETTAAVAHCGDIRRYKCAAQMWEYQRIHFQWRPQKQQQQQMAVSVSVGLLLSLISTPPASAEAREVSFLIPQGGRAVHNLVNPFLSPPPTETATTATAAGSRPHRSQSVPS